MEAGAAQGPAGGTATAPGDGEELQQQDGQQTQEQQAGLSPELAQQLSTIPDQLEQLRSWMEESQQAQQQAPGAEAEQEPAPADLSFVNPESPNYDPQAAAQQLLQVLEQQNADAVKAAVEPLQQQLQDQQVQREADFLAQEFPELEDPETADAVFRATREWVDAAGLPPEAAGNMQVVRAVFMMGRAAELHNEEQAREGQNAASLEGAGGASPGGTGQGGFTAQSILEGGGGRSPLPF
jgi:hypothetical protein